MNTDDEPGVPGQFDEDGRPYFSPSNQSRSADSREQRDGFIPRWKYRGHTDSVKDICVTGEDSFGRMRLVSTDGKVTASWLELSDGDSETLASGDHVVNALIFIPPLNVLAAAAGDSLLVFDGRTLRMVSTLPTSRKVLLQLEYNHARDEIISGGSDGCFVWRLEAIPCELYALEVVPFELRLLRGFKGCSHWAAKMIWDEASQVIITIDGMKVKTFDAVTTLNLHTIQKAHESPVTAGLWMGESENIVTGCMSGCIKLWACQHTDVNGGNSGRRRRRFRPCRRRRHRERTKKPRHGQSPALVELFEGHSNTITGLVRHCLNRSYILSCSADGTLRVWDVDRLAPVTSVQLSGAATSLWALWGPGGQCRLVYAEAEGSIRTMVVHQVYRSVSFDTEGARNVCYFPPLAGSAEEPRDVLAIGNCDKCLGGENGTRDPPEFGLVLVQMDQGLWGLLSELTTTATRVTQVDERRGVFSRIQNNISGEEEGGKDTATLQDGNTTSSLFYAWPPLSCVVERYSHHVLSRIKRKVVCLSGSGILDTYRFGPAKGEARKIQSRKVDLHACGATATCMCLLRDTPACVVAALDRVITSHKPSDTSCGHPISGNGRDGDDTGDEETCRDESCSGGRARKKTRQPIGGKIDQVVAIGTSRGGVLLVETAVNGTMLDFLEGVFYSKVFHMAFCSASTDDDIGDLVSGNQGSAACTKDAARLVCAGYNANGTVTIKGLAVSTLAETFSLHLIEVPTCVRVASRRPVLAVGFVDGALNAISFKKDRVQDLDTGSLIGAHTETIHTISFSMRYRCMATGSADGQISIWDLNGQQLHTIHLQSPAIAVEFMEVSGELLVSSSSGLCSIPSCRWCPSSLLVANERADRRAAAARTSSGSSSGSDGIPHQVPSATPTSGEGFASMTTQADGTTAGERGIRVHENASVAPHALTLDRRPPRAGEGCNSAGDRKINREEAQALAGNINGENERTCATRNIEEEPSRATDHREGTPPVGAGVGDEPEVPAPCRLTSYLTPRKASGSHDWREFSILDRMNAKFSSMPTSPPPPTMPTTKALKCLTHSVPIATPESPSISVKSCRDGEASGRALTGDRCDGTSAAPTWTRIHSSAPPNSGPNPRESDTISATNDTPSKGAVPKWAAGTVAQEVGAEGSGASLLAPAQASDTLRLPLSGRCLDGVTPCMPILGQDSAAWNLKGPKIPLPSTPRQRCTLTCEDGMYVAGQSQSAQFVSKTTAAPSSTEKRDVAAAAFDARSITPGFTVSRYIPTSRHQSARSERGPHFNGPENEAPVKETADGNHHILLDDLSSGQGITVPAAPTCEPPSWEHPSDRVARNRFGSSYIALKRCRQILAGETDSAVSSEQRRTPPGWTPTPVTSRGSGAGTAAAAAAKDVQHVMPRISISGGLEDVVSRSPRSPSPVALGALSPLSWGTDTSRLQLTPRMDSPPHSERATPFRNSGSDPIPGCAFFPVRPRAGRRTSVLAGRQRCIGAQIR